MVELTQVQHMVLTQPATLADIGKLDEELMARIGNKLSVQAVLTRQLVSFQANKARPAYRWYHFKEAFSAALVEYLLHHFGVVSGVVLDPFAGSGTALFAASVLGLEADGIELLPVGQKVVENRLLLEREFTPGDLAVLRRWSAERSWQSCSARVALPQLRITQGAYPPEAVEEIEQYTAAAREEDPRVRAALELALLSVLESLSYTRKDGQYLRWDYRSGRRSGKATFDKGPIPSLGDAIAGKLAEMSADLAPQSEQSMLFPPERGVGAIHLYDGSCLEVMPILPTRHYDAVITSPPYCNRYDYTRTYALEIAFLGVDEEQMRDLRQRMLTCTVENRAKDLLAMNAGWTRALQSADSQQLLQSILSYLDDMKARRKLNNSGIPRMVRGYFYEMACVIAECARVLKPGAPLIMVNDNVRYAGASISVDLILSDIAEHLGFRVENILVLPNCKGNSSQQMGQHGRRPLRKCVYVWRRD